MMKFRLFINTKDEEVVVNVDHILKITTSFNENTSKEYITIHLTNGDSETLRGSITRFSKFLNSDEYEFKKVI